jgi:hypothetical protein
MNFVVNVNIMYRNTHGEKRNEYRVSVGKPGGKRPLGIPRHNWEDNIKTDLREIGGDAMDWIDLTQDRYNWVALANTEINIGIS